MAIRITGMNSGMDTDAMIKDLVSTYDKQGEKIKKAKTKAEWKQEAIKSIDSKVKNFFSKYVTSMRFSDAYRKKATTVSDSTKASIVASDKAVSGTQTLEVNKLAKAGYLTGASLKGQNVTSDTKISSLVGSGFTGDQTVTVTSGGKDYSIAVNENTTVGDFVKSLNEVDGITASFDEANGRFFINSNESGEANDFSFASNAGTSADILSSLGLTGEGSVKQAGQDAQITLNGAVFTSTSNSFSINGLTITAKEETAKGQSLSITTDVDVDGIYKGIKDFITEYGKLINELDKVYNAESAKKFEPLSSEEKEAMTEEEIEKWETKIKDSLLRRDSDIDAIASAMRNSMLQAFTLGADENGEGGKVYSLSSFGIETLGYFEAADNEKNAYHIAGDPDDKNSSSGTDKLKAMIASDPNAVEGFFTKLVSGLYDNLNKISSTTNNYTSYGSFYNDKKMSSELSDKEKKIAEWEKYVAQVEDKYYKQFSAMEKALGNINSQQSYLSQLFSS